MSSGTIEHMTQAAMGDRLHELVDEMAAAVATRDAHDAKEQDQNFRKLVRAYIAKAGRSPSLAKECASVLASLLERLREMADELAAQRQVQEHRQRGELAYLRIDARDPRVHGAHDAGL